MLVTVGGTIPADDIPELKELGVAEVFTPGAPDAGHHRLHPGASAGAASTAHRGLTRDVVHARLTRQSTRYIRTFVCLEEA